MSEVIGFPKGKPKVKSKMKTVPASVMKIVEGRSKGVCEYCHSNKATDPHHICEIGMGGGNRLDIPINILHVCRICHNHDNTKFLQDANEILRERIDESFINPGDYEPFSWCTQPISVYLQVEKELIQHQVDKGFLKLTQGTERKYHHGATKEDIKRWLGVA